MAVDVRFVIGSITLMRRDVRVSGETMCEARVSGETTFKAQVPGASETNDLEISSGEFHAYGATNCPQKSRQTR